MGKATLRAILTKMQFVATLDDNILPYRVFLALVNGSLPLRVVYSFPLLFAFWLIPFGICHQQKVKHSVFFLFQRHSIAVSIYT